MATFQFSNHAIELDFCGQEHFSLEMTNEMQERYKSACEDLVEKSRSGADNFDELCDCVMDAIDKVIGEDGAADRILSIKDSYTFFDAIDVFKFISSEINAAVSETVGSYTQAGKNAYSNMSNREQRRAVSRMNK